MGAAESTNVDIPTPTRGSVLPHSTARYSASPSIPKTTQMKVIIMGSRCTGKSTLFQRLKGMKPPSLIHGEYQTASPQHDPGEIHSTSISWKSDEGDMVKLNVWDVVDGGDGGDNEEGVAAPARVGDSADVDSTPTGGIVGRSVARLTTAVVDIYASEVDGVIFMLNRCKPEDLVYIKERVKR